MKKFCYQLFQIYFVLSCLMPATAKACRGKENQPADSIERAYRNSSIAFIGKVVAVVSPKDKEDVVATFEILNSWKGLKKGNLSFPIETGRSCDLGKYVEVGSKWFLLANKPGERIITASHSQRLFDLTEEEALVKEIAKIK